MAFSISYVYKAINKFSPAVREMRRDSILFNRTVMSLSRCTEALTRQQIVLSRAVNASSTSIRRAAVSANIMNRSVNAAGNSSQVAVREMRRDSILFNRTIMSLSRGTEALTRQQIVLSRAVNASSTSMRRAVVSADMMNRSVKSAGDSSQSAFGEMATFASGVAAIAFPVKHAMEFEDAISNATKKMEDAEKGSKNFNLIKREVLDLAKASNKTAVEIAGVYSAGASGGFAGKELKAFASLTMKASIAFDMATEETGDALTKISGQMNIPINKMGAVADTVNHLTNSLANVEADEALNVMGRAAGQFSSFKISGEQAAGLAAFSLQMNTSAETAGTSITNLLRGMRRLSDVSEEVRVGMSINPTDTIKSVIGKIGKMKGTAQTDFLKDFFETDARELVLKAVGNIDKYSKAIATAGNKTKIAGSVQRECDAVMARSSSTMAKNTTKLKEISIIIGTSLLPLSDALFESLGFLAEIMIANKDILMVVAPVIGAAAGAFLLLKTAILLSSGAMAIFTAISAPVIGVFGAVSIAVVALLAGLYAAYENFESFRDSINSFFGWDEEKTMTVNLKRNADAFSSQSYKSPILQAAQSSGNAITANVNNRSTIDLNIKDKGGNVESVNQSSFNYSSMNTYGVGQ